MGYRCGDIYLMTYEFNYEFNEQKLVRKLVKEGMTTFDIGANIGDYSRLFSSLVGDTGRVFAFEPCQETFVQLLAKNADCSNITSIPKAVFSKNGKVILNEFPAGCSIWNSIGHPMMVDSNNPNRGIVPIENSVEVEAVSLDSFCHDFNVEEIDFMKIDVEGAEIYVLRGASELLKNKSIRYLQFEISQNMLDGLNTKAKYVFDFLASKDYKCYTITEDGNVGSRVIDSDSFVENYISYC